MTTDSGLWCQQRILVTLRGPETDISQTFDQPYVRVGADPGSDLVLRAQDETPHRCAYLHATDDGVYAVDLREDAEIRFGGWLAENDEMTIGPYRLSARLADSSGIPSEDALDLQIKQDAERIYPKLRVVLNNQVVAKVRIRRRLTVVGHRRPSTLRIINKHISACHCVLYWDGNDVWIIDLLSSNRSRIDDRLVHAAHLPPGSRLGLHKIALEYVGLSDIEPNSHGANASEDSDVALVSDSAGAPGESRNLSESNLDDTAGWSQKKDELTQVLKIQQEELDTLRKTLRAERQQWKAVMSDRKRELEEAAAAVQSAVRGLESQHGDFEEQNRLRGEEVDRKQQQLEQRIQTFDLKIQRQEELLSRWEKRMEKGLADVENTCRSLDHQWRVAEQSRDSRKPALSKDSSRFTNLQNSAFGKNNMSTPAEENAEVDSPSAHLRQKNRVDSLTRGHDALETQRESEARPLRTAGAMPDDHPIAASASPLSDEPDEARLQADKLSYEVCDRLVQRERSAMRRIWSMVAGFLVFGAVAGAAGVYFYQWLR